MGRSIWEAGGDLMRILVACEYSGRVRDAFTALGHFAMSCDFEASETPGPHYQGDVFDIINNDWDMMIAFPPCTHICSSGARHWHRKQKEQGEALEFVARLMDAPMPYIAIENPVGLISTRIHKPDQIIQPWQFGEREQKTTCLWLKNLPKLEPTNIMIPPESGRWMNQTPSGQNKLGPSPDRWKIRSRTYQGIANAMAQQRGTV